MPNRVTSVTDLIRTVTSIDLELLSKLFDLATDIAFFVKDAMGRYVAVNQSLLDRHGLERSEVLGKRPNEICPGDFGSVPTEQDSKVIRTRQPIIDHLEMQWYLPNKPVWCITTKLPIISPEGEILGIIGFSRDIRFQADNDDIPVEFAAALDYFELNLLELKSPSALAKRSGMTLQRLTRLTKRLYGLTPGQLITKTRIVAASRLLHESTTSISEVAIRCGFCDQSAFTRTFRSATGATPSQFRKHPKGNRNGQLD